MEKGKCRVNLILEFERAEKDTVINNLTSQEIAKKGDYIIKNPHGFSFVLDEQFVVDEEYFKENYEVIEEEKEKEITMPEILAKKILENTIQKFIKEIISPSFGINDFMKLISFKEDNKMIDFKERKEDSPLEGELKMDEKDIKNILSKGNYLFLSLEDYKRLTNLTPYEAKNNNENEEISKLSQRLYKESLDKSLVGKKKLLSILNDRLTRNPSRIPSNIDYYLKTCKELSEEIKDIENKLKEIDDEKM